MDAKQEIDAAIDAHAKWFVRLRVAIEKKSSEFAPGKVSLDNACDFGKWLYGSFPPHLKASPAYLEIRSLHASFHVAAAKVLELALAGKAQEALKALEPGGHLKQVSIQLVSKLTALKAQV
ncbi:MAG: CZB domain-containing protein [Deltaproteobacteria bacterium]|nr:CZB domain-containing protein [Deltaproteobacteria bacterium]